MNQKCHRCGNLADVLDGESGDTYFDGEFIDDEHPLFDPDNMPDGELEAFDEGELFYCSDCILMISGVRPDYSVFEDIPPDPSTPYTAQFPA